MIRTLRVALVALMALLAAAFALPAFAAAPLAGAIFTTDATCSGVDLNIYESKNDVYLNGGPRHDGAAGLPDGEYYVKVTEPDGALLGTSVGATDETPVLVSGGEFISCYQLSAILIKASDSASGYDDTSNPGGEYKAWVSTDPNFDPSNSKTDNFKVKAGGGEPQNQATLHVRKYYDANANGQYDSGEAYLPNWKFRIHDGIDWIRYTPADMVVDPDQYWVSEFKPVETNWIPTDTGTGPVDNETGTPTKTYTLAGLDDETAQFGNVCVGAGGGKTLGFWSNNNGQAKMNDPLNGTAPELALLSSRNLRNNALPPNDNNFNPATYAQFRTWLLSANATNMAYMLSAQLAAMELNVEGGLVNKDALIYAPGTTSANLQGFATVEKVMEEANADLQVNSMTVADGPTRTHQEALKNALDKANNNLNFVQASACPYTFAQ